MFWINFSFAVDYRDDALNTDHEIWYFSFSLENVENNNQLLKDEIDVRLTQKNIWFCDVENFPRLTHIGGFTDWSSAMMALTIIVTYIVKSIEIYDWILWAECTNGGL